MSRRRKNSAFRITAAAGAAVTLGLALLLSARFDFHWLVAYLAAVNCSTLVLYAYDKLASRRSLAWLRVPENVLHLFAFLGGTPSAYFAQQLLRHKTVKGRFRRVFWVLAVVQIALVAWALWYWHAERG